MARGKRLRNRLFKKTREEEDKVKTEPEKQEGPSKKPEEKSSIRLNSYFKSEEIQDICGLLNVEELGDHQCFLGAVVIGKFDVIKRLLKDGYSIDSLDENRETALIHAIRHFRLEIVDFLVTRGADISLTDGEGNNALLLAAQSSLWDQDSFSCLWQCTRDHPRLRPDHANKAGYSLLHYITKRQWKAVLELLLCVPVCINCRTNKGVTPLIMAASRGDALFVKALLDAGADITVEDQQKCTALCYAIAFSLQKNAVELNRALELILAAVNDEHSKLPLEVYLQRRLELLITPPKNRTEFSKTISSVLVHVLTFFARFIYSGIELLVELSVFQRLREAIERNSDDAVYITALLGVTLELVRHCDCCCQGLSQAELADAFFSAGLGKSCIDLLHRFGTTKTAVIKAVFLPLMFLCTSESYKARTWLEANHEFLQLYYNKYMRSFPAMFVETNGEPHLEIEKQHSLSFQNIMKSLKTQGWLVTKKEHKVSAKKEDQYSMLKPNTAGMFGDCLNTPEKKLVASKRKKSKPCSLYNSIIQYNFGKLDIVQSKKDTPAIEHLETSTVKHEDTSNNVHSIQKAQKEKKSRIAIKEIQQKQQISTPTSTECSDTTQQIKQNALEQKHNEKPEICSNHAETKSSTNDNDSSKKILSTQDVKERFSEGFQLFQIEDEPLADVNSGEEDDATKNACEWLDTYTSSKGDKCVSDVEVANTISYLEEIFNRIISRYDSTWKKQYYEGYTESHGDCEDLLKLMTLLPVLETYHMEKLITKWNNFCQQIKEHARKNHVIYADMVSQMQIFLLEFEADLEERNSKAVNDNDSLSSDSYIDTENLLKNLKNNNVCPMSNGEPVEVFINNNSMTGVNKIEQVKEVEGNKSVHRKHSQINFDETVKFLENIFLSDMESEEEENTAVNSIWDTKLKENFKIPEHSLSNTNLNAITKSSERITAETAEVAQTVEETNGVAYEDDKPMISLERSLSQTATTENHETLATNCSNKEEPLSCKSIQLLLEKITEELDIRKGKKTEKKTEVSEEDNNPTTLANPPPGFEDISTMNVSFGSLTSALKYCGTKYEMLSLALSSLPACKTELFDRGSLRLASIEFQLDFKLFNGCNFGDVELGLNATGIPLAVRRFQKHDSFCNKAISASLYKSISTMLGIRHQHILPYLACYDQPRSVVIAMPLCYQDLGQYIRHIRAAVADNPQSVVTIYPHLLTMTKQVMSGLHFLHTRDRPITHGNLKPSNILVDNTGTLRLSEFGLHEILFQQQGPALTSMIWWARDCLVQYYMTWKFVCSQHSDIQSAGMLLYFILSIGQHPYGQSLTEIIQNIKSGVILLRSHDVIAVDLMSWMLSHEPDKRPTTYDILRHVLFWSTDQRWEFLKTCCGLSRQKVSCPLPLEKVYKDLDLLGELRDINTKWITILKQNCERNIGSAFEDSPSGLLKFLNKNLENWAEVKDIFLELFPVLPLNLFRLVEQTIWIDHPEFERFTKVPPAS